MDEVQVKTLGLQGRGGRNTDDPPGGALAAGKGRVEFFLCFVRKLCKPSPERDERVGRHHAEAAGICDNGQPAPARKVLGIEDCRCIEQVGELTDPYYADPFERRVINLVVACHGACVR